MARRVHLPLLLLCVLLLLVAVAILAFHRRDPITLDAYERITSTMSDADVATLLGGPGEDVVVGNSPSAKRWLGRDAMIIVLFDGEGRVRDKVFAPYDADPIVAPLDFREPK